MHAFINGQYDLLTYFIDSLGSGHTRESNIMFTLPAEDVKLFPIDFYFERVVLDLCWCFGLADFIRDILFLLWFTHLHAINAQGWEAALNPNTLVNIQM